MTILSFPSLNSRAKAAASNTRRFLLDATLAQCIREMRKLKARRTPMSEDEAQGLSQRCCDIFNMIRKLGLGCD